jgi:hypothetical protein
MSECVETVTGNDPGTVETVQPEARSHPPPGAGDPVNDWLCVSCSNCVASEQDRFLWNGRSEFTFRNPEGVRFDLLTFSRTLGCREAGRPTLEHTWFSGHAWSFCLCARCGMHLGWYYAGPTTFAGLIAGRIVRAAVFTN